MYITLSQFRVEGDGTAFDEWLLPLADKRSVMPSSDRKPLLVRNN
jgi:hypothetical protein